MDIITLTDSYLGLDRQWVRITQIELNDDGTLTFTAEEYLDGTGHAAEYSFQPTGGFVTDYNADPGDTNTPVIFEAPVQIATTSGLEVWMVTSGGTEYGGCDVYISQDGETYKYAGTSLGQGRQGYLTADLPVGSDPDLADIAYVNVSESRGELLSGTQQDADLGNTLCYVGGELVAYQTATLTDVSAYALTYLRRGMYGTIIADHAPGTQFARLDQGKFVYSYDKTQIGQVIYIKLLAFNHFMGGNQSLADVEPYSHLLMGPPNPENVQNFLVVQNGNAVNFTWTQVSDYALKGYDIGYAAQGTTDWHEFSLLTEASKGTEMTNAAVPAGTWTFGIRARDIADQLSPETSTFDLVVMNNNDTTTIQVQEPDFAGSMTGFVRHWTGVLIPESTSMANAYSDYTLFDAFVTDPVSSASYITPTFDIGFEDSLRVHTAYSLTEGPGQSGSPTADIQIDAWTTGSDPGTYVDWTVGTIDVRYLNMKIIYQPTAGTVAYLTDFTYTVDRSPVLEQTDSVTIAAGGTAINFPSPFHDIPTVIPTVVSGSALYATASAISMSGCTINIWDSTGTSVGGTAAYSAKGI